MRRHQVLERSLASATAIGLLVVLFFILALPAQAHTWSVTHDCAGLNVVLRDYNTTGDNSLSITIDGQQVDIADFGRDHNESINWDPTQPHTYNVTVMAHDDLDGSIGWSFSVNDSQERCVNPTTTTAPTAVTTTTATASTIPDEVLPTSIPTSTEPEGSPTDVLPFTGSDDGPGAPTAPVVTTTTAPATTATASTIPDEVLPTSIPTSTEPEGSPTDVLPFTGSDDGPGAPTAPVVTTTTAPATTATASTIPDEVLPTSIPTSTEPEGSPTDVLPFTGSDGGPGALWAVILISGGLIILTLRRRRHLRPRRRHLRPRRPHRPHRPR